MSVIQNIRNKYAGVTIGLIVLAMIGFILMDAFSNRSAGLFGNDSSVATINGEKLDYVEYQRRVQDYEVLYGASQNLDDNTKAQIQQQAMDDLIRESIIMEESDELGLQTTEAEKKDLIYGQNPDPAVVNYQAFRNQETNAFDPQYVRMFEEQVDQLDPSGKARQHWETLKSYILRNNVSSKYNALFSGGMYVPNYLIQYKMKQEQEKANFDFVNVTYENVADEEVKVSDDEMKAYMKDHKKQYSINDASRTIEYVMFRLTPSAEDTARALGVLEDIKEDFASAEDAESFVNRNSDEGYEGKYVMKNTFMSQYSNEVFNTEVGSVYGPYFENNNYKLVKVLDKKSYPDSVKCRHILVKTEDRTQPVLDSAAAKSKLDSAIAAIKSGAMTFDQAVQQYSDDEGSKTSAGEYTFSFDQKANLSKEFADFIFEGNQGQKEIVRVQNSAYAGYHYIEILEQKGFQPALKLAILNKGLYAGEGTENAVYGKASEFAADNGTKDAFDKAVKDGGVDRRIADNLKETDFTINGVGPAREVIRWAYEAEAGDVSDVFPVNNGYLVAKLSQVNKKGLMELDDNLKIEIQERLKTEKKGKMIADKYKGKSLQDISSATNRELQSADSVSGANPFMGPIGYEPKVAGYVFYPDFKEGTMSPPIAGQTGVYFIKLKNRFTDSSPIDSNMMQRERQMQQSQFQNGVNGMLMEMLKKEADVKYNTENF